MNQTQVASLAQRHRPGELMQTDGTWPTELGVTIAGQPFRYILIHCVLCYSNWEWGCIGQSESIVAIRQGVQVIGMRFVTSELQLQAFIWQDGVLTGPGHIGIKTSYAGDINDAGEVAGDSVMVAGARHAFLWKNGAMTDLGTLNGALSTTAAINEAGEVAGAALTGAGRMHAVLWLAGGGEGAQGVCF